MIKEFKKSEILQSFINVKRLRERFLFLAYLGHITKYSQLKYELLFILFTANVHTHALRKKLSLYWIIVIDDCYVSNIYFILLITF
jgi:hypothetical protein